MSFPVLTPADYFGLLTNILLLLSLLGIILPIFTIVALKILRKCQVISNESAKHGFLGKIPIFSLILLVLAFILRFSFMESLPAFYDWYDKELKVDAASLPAGVEIVEITSPYQDFGIKNVSHEAFYLGYHKGDEGWKYATTTPVFRIRDESGKFLDYKMRFKLVSGEIYECSDKLPGDVPDCVWKTPSGTMDTKRKLLNLFGNRLVSVSGGIKGVRKGTPNPPDYEIPDPEPFVIHGYYKGKLWNITGTLTYYLKSSYTDEF